MKKLFAVVLVMSVIPIVALAQWRGNSWFGKTTVETGNLDIAVQSFRTGVPMVSLLNRSNKPASCSATFSNGLQFTETRSASIVPGKKAPIGYGVHYITEDSL